MDDCKGENTAPQETKEYWEKEKARLEASKLNIEFQNYRERLQLEDEKLRSDLKDWYFRAFIAVVTTATSVAFFFIGKAFQNSSDEHKQVYELQLQRDRIENEEFNKNITMLSSADTVQRAIAVATLSSYVQNSQKDKDKATQDQARQRIEKVLGAISVRLPSETDPFLMQEYAQLMMLTPSISLPYAVLLNQGAGPQFARSAAQYVAWNLRNPSRFLPEGCENGNATNQQEVSERVGEVADLTTRTEMPFEGQIYESGAPLRTRINAHTLLSVNKLAKLYQIECRRTLVLSSQEKNDQRMNQRMLSSNEVSRAAQFLSLSSFALNRILRSLSGHLAKNQDLSATFMVAGSLDDLDLSNANLEGSLITASAAEHFICRNCDFSNADLSQFNLKRPFDVQGSIFKGVIPSDALKNYVPKEK